VEVTTDVDSMRKVKTACINEAQLKIGREVPNVKLLELWVQSLCTMQHLCNDSLVEIFCLVTHEAIEHRDIKTRLSAVGHNDQYLVKRDRGHIKCPINKKVQPSSKQHCN
jgi:hypothetical protein